MLRALFDDHASALLVVRSDGQVHAANRTARDRFPFFQTGRSVWGEGGAAENVGRKLSDLETVEMGGWTFGVQPLGEGFVLLESYTPANPLRDPVFRRFADALPVIVWMVDANDSSRFLNRTWKEYTGLTGKHEAWWEALHPDDLAATQALWQQARSTRSVFETQYRFRRADGAYVWHLVQGTPQFHPDGSLWGWIGVCTSLEGLERAGSAQRLLDDLSRERAEYQDLVNAFDSRVEERTKQLEAVNRALEARNHDLYDFAYAASHDLQEPLRKIGSYADLLRLDFGDALPDEGRHYLDRIQNASARMSRLVRDLLAFSRVTTNVHPPEPINLAAVLDDVTSDLGLILRETGGRVDIGPLPEVVADPTQMRQLLQNLVQNALKYRRNGVAPVVRVEGHTVPIGAPKRVVLTVADNGRGFDPKDAERIFQPFQRLVGRDIEGTGFGLPIVRKIAERHGGTVTATATPGAGATFTVTLPVATA